MDDAENVQSVPGQGALALPEQVLSFWEEMARLHGVIEDVTRERSAAVRTLFDARSENERLRAAIDAANAENSTLRAALGNGAGRIALNRKPAI